jgi:hypothetical protein
LLVAVDGRALWLLPRAFEQAAAMNLIYNATSIPSALRYAADAFALLRLLAAGDRGEDPEIPALGHQITVLEQQPVKAQPSRMGVSPVW